MQHSKIVGGSTAKRVINCPGSVSLVQKMPPQPENEYMREGTLLHACMEELVGDGDLTAIAAKNKLTDEQVEKLEFCLRALDEIDPTHKMVYVQEMTVGFPGVPELEGVFGNADLVGVIDDRVVILDWKFGDGVMVGAEENSQGLFYAAAARRTAGLEWAFERVNKAEIIIVQPPHVRRWVTDLERLETFERELIAAVRLSSKPNAPIVVGDWCRFCTAKPICPQMTGAIDRVTKQKLELLDGVELARALELADKLESFIKDARAIAQQRLEKNIPVPGYKLVPKRATRQWADSNKAINFLGGHNIDPWEPHKVISPAQAEAALKKRKLALPDDLVVAVSSGDTIAPESDPRPAKVLLGQQLAAALSKLQ